MVSPSITSRAFAIFSYCSSIFSMILQLPQIRLNHKLKNMESGSVLNVFLSISAFSCMLAGLPSDDRSTYIYITGINGIVQFCVIAFQLAFLRSKVKPELLIMWTLPIYPLGISILFPLSKPYLYSLNPLLQITKMINILWGLYKRPSHKGVSFLSMLFSLLSSLFGLLTFFDPSVRASAMTYIIHALSFMIALSIFAIAIWLDPHPLFHPSMKKKEDAPLSTSTGHPVIIDMS
ncbi:uncharacterized protein MONOS_1193 [Monocercomonoides exilis]|uniref:uncharacterized protein n=1 Tax=Monocercomonoides exilis TaxID=2049356 RepID=UPI00355A7B05|nr:hypothetical protein MONOS_1193 [Monocercomonoides exilis]